MTTTSLEIPAHRALTIEDLAGFPADSNRYELIDGALHVSPSPVLLHQRVVFNIAHDLREACPVELEVLPAPVDVILGPSTLVIPDVFVIPVDRVGLDRIENPPLLVVEVLSPSTRLYDLGTKSLAYRAAGVTSYWVVDPVAPTMTEYRWEGGAETARTAEGDEPLVVERPFPLTIVPAELVKPAGDRRRAP